METNVPKDWGKQYFWDQNSDNFAKLEDKIPRKGNRNDKKR